MFEVLHEDIILPIFLRLIFVAWGLHFYDLSTQALCCGGSKGLSPVHVQIKAAKLATKSKWKRFMKIKTIFWLNDDDWFIQLVPRLGILSSILGMVGYFSNVMFAINFIIYHSIDCIFWDGMQFPWENLMFELGFMSIFSPTLLPYDIHQVIVHPWNSYLIWSYQWLLFRLMFGFGKTKFIDDNVTTDNSLYIYHFLFSQPMPNKLAKFVTDYAPRWKFLWKGALAHMWFVEIPLPFLYFHSYTRMYAFYGTLSLQAGIFFTGCFGGFNFLTCILCLSLLIDGSSGESLDWSLKWNWCLWCLWCLYIFVSIICLSFFNSGNTQMWSYWADLTRHSLNKPIIRYIINFVRYFNEFRVVHGYGVFPKNKLVHVRLKHVIEGKWENNEEMNENELSKWEAYKWKYLGEYHWSVAPFQPKMDFIMWYNGNGMNLEGFTVAWASSRPTMFSECGMPSRIARRCQEGSSDVLSHFKSIPSFSSSPNDMRLRIVDDNNEQFLAAWSPEPWTNWMPSIEEYHWDAYLVRLQSDIFLNSVQKVEQFLLNDKNILTNIIVSRDVMEYDGNIVSYQTIHITGNDLSNFFNVIHAKTITSTTSCSGRNRSNDRKNRFILTYLTWIIVHRVLTPWPEERSWFELSIIAHSIILSGWEKCLSLIKNHCSSSSSIDKYVMSKDTFLNKNFINNNIILWKQFYCYQWEQTKRTFEKLYRFDYWNTGSKLPIKGAGVLAYPHLFINGWEDKRKKRLISKEKKKD